MIFYLSFIACFIILFFIYFITLRTKNFPPGPILYPFVGCAPQFRKLTQKLGSQHAAIVYLSKKYKSSVIGLKLGSQLTVTISGYNEVKNALTKEEFEGRPDNFFMRMRCLGTRKGITCTDGSHWHQQRSFAVKHLKSLGFGRTTMESLIQEEVNNAMDLFATKEGEEFCPEVAPSVMSVLWKLTAGTGFTYEDKNLNKLLDLMQRRAKVFDMTGGTLSQFPFLRFIAPERSGYNLLKTVNQELKTFFMDTIEQHKATFSIEEPRDLIDAYLKEMEVDKYNKDSTFTEEQLIMVCLDMFIAGSTTTSATLSFAILILSRFKEIQKKIRDEIKKNLINDKFPSLSDQTRLPYLCAFITEIYRVYGVAPMAGPKRVLKDTTFNGFNISKNTTVLINLWSANNDPNQWKNPDEFLPERFIKNSEYKKDETIFSFGLGRRRCLGEILARGFIFIFLAKLLQTFEIISNEKGKLTTPPISGLTLCPPPFKIVLKKSN